MSVSSIASRLSLRHACRLGLSQLGRSVETRATHSLGSQPWHTSILKQGRAFTSAAAQSQAQSLSYSNLERQIQQEIDELQRNVEDQQKAESSNENLGSDPAPLSEDKLDLLYQALQAPDPALPEDIRLDARRRRLLDYSEQGSQNAQLQRSSLRIADIQRRLDVIENSHYKQSDISSEDPTNQILATLKSARLLEPQSESDDDVTNEKQDIGSSSDADTIATTATVAATIVPAKIVLDRIEAILPKGQAGESSLPTGLVTMRDWKALARASAAQRDLESLQKILYSVAHQGLQRFATPVANVALDIFAHEGDVLACRELTAAMVAAGVELDEYSRHTIVKSFVRAHRFMEAINALKAMESSTPAGMASYTLVIDALLLQSHDKDLQSRAWTVFRQMRLAAHPVPDAPLYAQMIKACALGVTQPNEDFQRSASSLMAPRARTSQTSFAVKRQVSDVERALDLFREMTSRYNIRPTSEVYTAIISACAGRHDTYAKAIEIFQNTVEMERGRLASGDESTSSFAPDREVYNALLRGCARTGDLLRARWVLAEMLRSSAALLASLRMRESATEADYLEVEARRPNAETIALIFYSYASFVPGDSSGNIKTLKGSKASSVMENITSADIEAVPVEKDEGLDHDAFSQRMPSSSAAAMREVDGLLSKIQLDRHSPDGLLSNIAPHSRMLNAYLAVLNKHAEQTNRLSRVKEALYGSEEDSSLSVFPDGDASPSASLFEYWGVPLNEHTIEVALDACAKAKGKDHALRDKLSTRLWTQFKLLTNSTSRRPDGLNLSPVLKQSSAPLNPRLDRYCLTRCWAAMIRNLAKSLKIDEAMALLHTFVQENPPRSIGAAVEGKGSQQEGSLTPPSQVSSKLPSLTFNQLSFLHHRLLLSRSSNSDDQELVKQRTKDIAFVTWMAKAYEADARPPSPSLNKSDSRQSARPTPTSRIMSRSARKGTRKR